jgi:hypothetical protein
MTLLEILGKAYQKPGTIAKGIVASYGSQDFTLI